MARIALSGGLVALIDDADVELTTGYNWKPDRRPNGQVYVRADVYGPGQHRRVRSIKLHRLILGLSDPKVLADHRNHDGLDNRRDNLRVATASQNGQNRRPNAGTVTGLKGVFEIRECRPQKYRRRYKNKVYEYTYAYERVRYEVKIKAGGRVIRGGKFSSPEKAARRYDELARLHHGEFACLNFPGG